MSFYNYSKSPLVFVFELVFVISRQLVSSLSKKLCFILLNISLKNEKLL